VFYTDGTQDVTGAPSLFVNRLAREVAPVRVTGNYGDEVMRDNTTLKTAPLREEILTKEFATMVRSATLTLAAEHLTPRLSFILRKQVPWLHYARLAVEQTQLTVRTPFLDNDIVRLQFRCPPVFQKSVGFALSLIAAGDPRMAHIPTDRGHAAPQRRNWGRPREWWQALLIRAEYFYDYGMPQAAVGRCENIGPWNVERLFLGRHKYYHFRTWYRHELAAYVKEMLLDPRTLGRDHLDRGTVERMVTDHTTGRGNYTVEIHKLLTYELIYRQLIDSTR
jgi:asparagine synthase (glutamine-hydrolysing)